MGFWHNVENECEYRGISRKELASAADFSVHTISNGIKRNSIPSVDIALRISHILNIDLEDLIDENFSAQKSNLSEQKTQDPIIQKYIPLIHKIENLPTESREAVYTIINNL